MKRIIAICGALVVVASGCGGDDQSARQQLIQDQAEHAREAQAQYCADFPGGVVCR